MYIGVHVKYPFFFPGFNETWITSTEFRRILKYQILWKTVRWNPSCSMRMDGQTDRWSDMTNLMVAFSNLANAPKKTTDFSCISQLIFCFMSRKKMQNLKWMFHRLSAPTCGVVFNTDDIEARDSTHEALKISYRSIRLIGKLRTVNHNSPFPYSPPSSIELKKKKSCVEV